MLACSCAHMHAQLRWTLPGGGRGGDKMYVCIFMTLLPSLSALILNALLYSEVTYHGSLEAGNLVCEQLGTVDVEMMVPLLRAQS